jgi:hypothetical protein
MASREEIRQKMIEKIKAFVCLKNGKVPNIEKQYKNNYSKITYVCEFKHSWDAMWCNVGGKRKKWCSVCSGNKKLDLGFCIKLAEKFGGKCLEDKYINSATRMLWGCKYGHKFGQSVNHINSSGCWCPICSCWSSEAICRKYFETIFEKEFPKIRPDWLIGFKNYPLELDGYCAELNLAFEHNGMFHYEKSIFIGENNFYKDQDLEYAKEKDKLKIQKCKENGITLIVIPQLFAKTKLKDLKNIIKIHCIENNIIIPENYNDIKVDLLNIYIGKENTYFKKIIKIIEDKGGKCLTENSVNCKIMFNVMCEKHHLFSTNSNRIQQGQWCPECVGRCQTIETLKNLAKTKGGECLSNKYKGVAAKYEWKCYSCEKIWLATAYSIKSGSWCGKNLCRKINNA